MVRFVQEFFNFSLYLMSKGYWIKHVSIPNSDLFMEYIKTVIPWLLSVGGIIIAKEIKQDSDFNEWDGGKLGVIVEFESKRAAQKAFESDIFQEYLELNCISSSMSLSIIG